MIITLIRVRQVALALFAAATLAAGISIAASQSMSDALLNAQKDAMTAEAEFKAWTDQLGLDPITVQSVIKSVYDYIEIIEDYGAAGMAADDARAAARTRIDRAAEVRIAAVRAARSLPRSERAAARQAARYAERMEVAAARAERDAAILDAPYTAAMNTRAGIFRSSPSRLTLEACYENIRRGGPIVVIGLHTYRWRDDCRHMYNEADTPSERLQLGQFIASNLGS